MKLPQSNVSCEFPSAGQDLPMSALGHKRTSAHVRMTSALPPKADIGGAQRDVRFVPKADIAPPHSITWSARAISDDGTVRPNALAVFKLIVSSYLVGACTGRSAGFSPLRIRST
jgi:hypothetical protein